MARGAVPRRAGGPPRGSDPAATVDDVTSSDLRAPCGGGVQPGSSRDGLEPQPGCPPATAWLSIGHSLAVHWPQRGCPPDTAWLSTSHSLHRPQPGCPPATAWLSTSHSLRLCGSLCPTDFSSLLSTVQVVSEILKCLDARRCKVGLESGGPAAWGEALQIRRAASTLWAGTLRRSKSKHSSRLTE